MIASLFSSMAEFARSLLLLFLATIGWHIIRARHGMTIDKLECFGNPSMCSSTHCSLTVAANDPFVTEFSFDCNMTKSCSSIYVSVKFEEILVSYADFHLRSE
jgi:hypothetical protein